MSLHNALPVPADLTLMAWGRRRRLHLGPNERCALRDADAAHVDYFTLSALGYCTTARMVLPAIPPRDRPPAAADGAAAAAAANVAVHELHAPDAALTLHEIGPGQATAQISVRHSVDTVTGRRPAGSLLAARPLRLLCWPLACCPGPHQ